MAGRTIFPDMLADFPSGKPANNPGPQKKRDQEGGNYGINGPKGDVPEDIKKRNVFM
jgi:hypothetical protein